MSSIELREVSRAFESGNRAVDAVSLTVADGERMVVLGPSGSGKTTLLRLIAGLDRPTSGGVGFGGAAVDDLPPHRRNVAMVFQQPTLYPHLTVAGNLEFGLKTRGVPGPERLRRVAEIAGMLQIDGLLGRTPASLSGGERQRVAIGRAIVRRPAVLLLDEPFSSLDLPLRAALRRQLIELHEAFRTTMVHVTHDQGEAMSLGHRVAVLDHGQLIQVASPRDLYERPASPFVATFVGNPPMNLIPCKLIRDGGRATLAIGEQSGPIDLNIIPDLAEGETRSMLLGIRPEHLRVHSEGDVLAFPAIASRIRRVEFQGDSALVTLNLAGTTAVARVANLEELHEDQELVVSVELVRVVWFPNEG